MCKECIQLTVGLLMVCVGIYGFVAPIPYPMGATLLLIAGALLALSGWLPLRRRRLEKKYEKGSPRVADALRPRVAALRRVGFFADYAGLTDDQVVDALVQKYEDDWGGEPYELVRAPITLALLDPAWALHCDTEMDPLPGDGGYTEFIEGLARISRQHFIPRSIQETLSEDREHVDLRVETDARLYEFQLEVNDDWMDGTILGEADQLLDDPAYRFYVPSWGGQDLMLLCLTEAEHKELRALGWAV